MSNFCKQFLVLPVALTLTLTALFSQRVQAQNFDDYSDQAVSTQTFYDELAPYGQWIEDAQYGYVWAPNVDENFRPYYTSGHWVMTEYGNTWYSDYPWGWAAFHYGRWTYDNYYGWLWIPGNTWGPAWVSWRQNDSYYGWAPLGPGINVSESWGGGYYCPENWWVFIPSQYLYRHNYYHYWYGTDNNRAIIRNTTVINNTYVNHGNRQIYIVGPHSSEVERRTNQQVTVYHLNSARSPRASSVSNGNVTLYRPMQVNTLTQYGSRPQPAIISHASQPVNRTPQAPVNGTVPSFHQQSAYRNDNNGMPQPNNQPNGYRERQRYEYNPQQRPIQQNATPEYRQPQAPRQEPQQQNFNRPQPNVERPAPTAPQNIQRSQPAISRPVAAPRPEPQQQHLEPTRR